MDPVIEFPDLIVATPTTVEIPLRVIRNFQRRIVKTNSCWLFNGAISSPDGYGRVTFTLDGREQTYSAHRLAVLIEHGTLPDSAVVEHRCNEPLCVRVDANHVFVSTQADNLAWAVASGRAAGPRKIVDSHRRVQRSRAVRQLLRTGWDPEQYATIIEEFSKLPPLRVNSDQLFLPFDAK